MNEYIVYFQTGASASAVVEAKTAEEAQEKADQLDLPSLCAHCSGWGQRMGVELGDWEQDGEVEAR